MSSLYLNRLTPQQRTSLVKELHESQHGNCFICGHEIDLALHEKTIDIDHIEPTRDVAGNPYSPQAVVFLTSIIDVIVGY